MQPLHHTDEPTLLITRDLFSQTSDLRFLLGESCAQSIQLRTLFVIERPG
jgi:hypothetical protein